MDIIIDRTRRGKTAYELKVGDTIRLRTERFEVYFWADRGIRVLVDFYGLVWGMMVSILETGSVEIDQHVFHVNEDQSVCVYGYQDYQVIIRPL